MLLESSLAVRGRPAALGSSLAQTISGPPVRKFLSCVGTSRLIQRPVDSLAGGDQSSSAAWWGDPAGELRCMAALM